MGMLVWISKFLSFALLIILLSQAIFSSVSFTSSVHLCPPDQNLALLQFKNMISLNNCSYQDPDIRNLSGIKPRKILSWKEGTDCCSWDGVSCDKVTGSVIGLDLGGCQLYGTIGSNSGLFLLSHLQRLNLADNAFCWSDIPSAISELVSLTHLNLSNSDFSGSVPQEISHVSKLLSLDLSSNPHLHIETPAMERLVQNMTKLRAVLLNGVNMSDVAPHSLVNLSSSLRTLNLDSCYSCLLGDNYGGEFPVNIFRLPHLQSVQLSFTRVRVNFPKSNWTSPLRFLEVAGTGLTGNLPNCIVDLKYLEQLSIEGTGELPNSIGNLVSLKHLFLRGNFSGSIPASIGNLSHITVIDLTNNNFRGELPSSLGKLQNLMDLDLQGNNFTPQLLNVFTNLTKLTSINLRSNNFIGQLLFSLFNLTQLAQVDFSNNQLTGPIPSDITIHAGLVSLDISDNLLKGPVPSWLFVLPLLERLDLSHNQLDGHIDDFQANSSRLLNVDISNNKLHGKIPSSLFELERLTSLKLSSNNMTGFLDLEMISKLKNLSALDLSYNSLTLSSSSTVNYTFPMFSSLSLSSCNITEFPIFLKDSTFVQDIDLSNNKIHGQAPEWFFGLGKGGLTYLNLSHNFLTSFRLDQWFLVQVLDLHSNLLRGSLPNVLPCTEDLFLSDNKFSGEIPPSFCIMSSMGILDLSNNSLNGTIPQCLGNFSRSLFILDLRMNNFYGTIPAEFGICEFLTTLALNGNNLEGLLPRSLLNCNGLEVLDVGNNKIIGEFPHWLGSLPNLQVLVLRSNKFQGPIVNSTTKFPFPMLRIMDISRNEFTGPLPAFYFKNFEAMMTVDQRKSQLEYMGIRYYQDSMMVTMKGIEIKLVRILSILTTIDLSNNNFSGKIPRNIGKLKSLKGLNFSHNHLVGQIPSSMGSLTNLEWLDLSSNELAGKIPEEMLDLTSLEVLNLSHNKLTGQIPEGRQFNTFSNDSYIGNLGLCGFPLSKLCNPNETQQPPPPSFSNDSKIGFGWKVVAVGYGCGVLFGLIMGCLVFSTGKPQWLVRLVGGDHPRRRLKRTRNGHRRHGIRSN